VKALNWLTFFPPPFRVFLSPDDNVEEMAGSLFPPSLWHETLSPIPEIFFSLVSFPGDRLLSLPIAQRSEAFNFYTFNPVLAVKKPNVAPFSPLRLTSFIPANKRRTIFIISCCCLLLLLLILHSSVCTYSRIGDVSDPPIYAAPPPIFSFSRVFPFEGNLAFVTREMSKSSSLPPPSFSSKLRRSYHCPRFFGIYPTAPDLYPALPNDDLYFP